MKRCPNCGKITDRKFCSSCGTSLIDVLDIEEQNDQKLVEVVQEDTIVNVEPSTEDIEVDEDVTKFKAEGEHEQIPASVSETVIGDAAQKNVETTSKLDAAAPAVDEKPLKQPISGKKKMIIAAIAVVVVVIIIAVAGIGASKASKEKAAKEAYDSAVLTMRTNSSMMWLDVTGLNVYEDKIDNMEELINLSNSVWHDSIYELKEDDTYEYIKGTSDFNEALKNLYYSTPVIEFNNQLDDHLDLIKRTTDFEAPSNLSDAKSAYVKVLTAYQALVSWCKWPNGSYSTYMEQSQAKYDEFMNAYNEFDVLCPEWENPEETDD